VKQCDIRDATHVKAAGVMHRIADKWGVFEDGRLANPSDGGFGCITDQGRRVSMYFAQGYFREEGMSEERITWETYIEALRDHERLCGQLQMNFHALEAGPSPEEQRRYVDQVIRSLMEASQKIAGYGLECVTHALNRRHGTE